MSKAVSPIISHFNPPNNPTPRTTLIYTLLYLDFSFSLLLLLHIRISRIRRSLRPSCRNTPRWPRANCPRAAKRPPSTKARPRARWYVVASHRISSVSNAIYSKHQIQDKLTYTSSSSATIDKAYPRSRPQRGKRCCHPRRPPLGLPPRSKLLCSSAQAHRIRPCASSTSLRCQTIRRHGAVQVSGSAWAEGRAAAQIRRRAPIGRVRGTAGSPAGVIRTLQSQHDGTLDRPSPASPREERRCRRRQPESAFV